jgi:hypothetical protein
MGFAHWGNSDQLLITVSNDVCPSKLLDALFQGGALALSHPQKMPYFNHNSTIYGGHKYCNFVWWG